MNTSNCLHCGTPIQSSGRGQPRKFCSDSHKTLFNRANKIKAGPTLADPTPAAQPVENFKKSPQPASQGPTREQLLANCWKHLPPHIAAYMPVQPHQSLQECLQQEAARSGHTRASAAPKEYQLGQPIPFTRPTTTTPQTPANQPPPAIAP